MSLEYGRDYEGEGDSIIHRFTYFVGFHDAALKRPYRGSLHKFGELGEHLPLIQFVGTFRSYIYSCKPKTTVRLGYYSQSSSSPQTFGTFR
jgi:hypothetical protein